MTPPRRQLGLSIAAAIVIANMIGTGVFTSAGFQAASLHDPRTMLLTWIVGGVLALCGAAAYAELGAMMPRAGGEYVYLREAHHPAVGFMSGWVSLTAGFSAPIAVAALAFARYVSRLVPAIAGAPWTVIDVSIGGHHLINITIGPQQALAIALIVAIASMHAIDTKVGGWVQAVFTAAKVLLIVGFILGGLAVGAGHWSHLAPQDGGLANVASRNFAVSLMYVSFAYSGWNAAATEPWLLKILDTASHAAWGAGPAMMGEGGTIPFMHMLGQAFPKAQFVVTGVLGPNSNAHGPNEFLHIPTGRRVTDTVAHVLAAHAAR